MGSHAGYLLSRSQFNLRSQFVFVFPGRSGRHGQLVPTLARCDGEIAATLKDRDYRLRDVQDRLIDY